MEGFIYILIDPTDNRTRYVGQTTDTKKRLFLHWTQRSSEKHINNHKNNWIKKLWDVHRMKPLLAILEHIVCDDMISLESKMNERELYWIDALIKAGCDLTNTSHKFYARIANHHKTKQRAPHAQTVYCYSESGELTMYESVHFAAKSLDIDHRLIRKSIKNCGISNNLIFSTIPLNGPDIKSRFDNRRRMNTPILVSKDGVVTRYENQTAASKSLKIQIGSINHAIINNHKCFGYTISYDL